LQAHYLECIARDGVMYEFEYCTEALASGSTVLFCLITVEDPTAQNLRYYNKVWTDSTKWVMPVFYNFQGKFINDVDYRRQYLIEGVTDECPG